MVKEIRVYIEGDNKQKGKNNNISLREGFYYFFKELREKAKDKKIEFRSILSGGSKSETYKDFLKGVETHKDSFVSFLIDSDIEVGERETAKSFLQRQNPNWILQAITDEQCHLMAQIMESWFIADIEALQDFYGQHFNPNAIPKHVDIEKVSKRDVENALESATQNTTKGIYHKVKHGAELLRKVDLQKVKAKAKYCRRFFDVIEEKIDQS